jgi:hypothetical protein
MVKMALPVAFSLNRSEFNAFLFAPIGEEGNGMPLSVLSALSRLDIDPWQEAARLAKAPKELAAATLDGLIGRLPPGRWGPSDTRAIAARLVELLPRGAAAAPAGGTGFRWRERPTPRVTAWLLVLALGAAVLLGLALHKEVPSGAAGPPAAVSSTSPAANATQ